MVAAPERIEIDTVDFEVPCRRFTIRATITRDRQLPVVEEFVLRMLAVLDRVSIRRLRTWFGFTEAEIQTVLIDLKGKAQVDIDGDDAMLAPAGRDLFRATPEGGVPRIVEVATLVDHVWFDLVSRNMVPRSRARSVDYLVRLREQPSARELPASFAREAFEANFRDYTRRVARLEDPDSVNIYAVSDVEAGTYSYQSVRAAIELDPVRSALRPRFLAFEEEPSRFHALTLNAVEEWGILSTPETSQTSASEYERLTGDQLVAPILHNKPDVDTWRELLTAPTVPTFRRSVGAAYLDKNINLLSDVVTDLRGIGTEAAEIVWLRPSGTGWGRSRRVAEALQKLKDMLRNIHASEVRTRIAMPRSTHKSVRKSHRRLFDRGELLPQGQMPPNIEILLVDGIAALVNLHLDLGGHSAPVGGLVTDQKRLSRMVERLQPRDSGWESLWEPSSERRDGQKLER